MFENYCLSHESSIAAFLADRTGLEQFTPGLDRILPVFAPIVAEFRRRGVSIVTIAGTNGKGQTSMCLAHLLTHNGQRPATWTSPHILSIRERFAYMDQNIDYSELESLLQTHWDLLERSGHRLSYYEFLFYLFCQYALTRSPTHLILEVGLGGRYDAVNLFSADLAAITSISRDHQAILGNSYRKILWEKIGVARANAPLVTLFPLGFLRQQTDKMLEQIGAKHIDLSRMWGSEPDYSTRNQLVAAVLCGLCVWGDQFNIKNAPELLKQFPIPTFRGRKERVTRGKRSFIFIGAHNVEGMRVLYTAGMRYPHGIVAFSSRPLADVIAAYKISSLICDQVTLTSFDHPKALSRHLLTEILPKATIEDDWRSYLRGLFDVPGETVIMGSYYFIGEVQKYFATL